MNSPPLQDYNIDVIDWKLIGSCNLQCLHCYGPPKSVSALPLQDLQRIAEAFSEISPTWVVLTGGEPLLVEGIDVLMRDLTSHGINIALSTNTSFFKKFQHDIEANVSSLNIPIDGSTPEIHARSRKNRSSYYTAFKILDHYSSFPQNKPELLRVGTVYSKATQGDLRDTAARLEEFAEVIDRWKIYELMDYEIQPNLRRELLHDPADFEHETLELMDYLSYSGSALASKVMISSAKSRNKAYFMVNPKGIVVMPTEIQGRTYEKPLGHILKDPLSNILNAWTQEVSDSCFYDNHSHYTVDNLSTIAM